MGHLRRIVECMDARIPAVRLRRGEEHASKTKEQRDQDQPSCHNIRCLSAASNWPLRGKG